MIKDKEMLQTRTRQYYMCDVNIRKIETKQMCFLCTLWHNLTEFAIGRSSLRQICEILIPDLEEISLGEKLSPMDPLPQVEGIANY